MSVISLITDFGTKDEYAGVMKGVILSICPEARIVDVTHHIPSHDVLQAAFLLQSSYMYFPAGTVHLIVVDPGVGSDRAIVAMKKGDYYFIAPDNGLLSFIIEKDDVSDIISVKNSKFFLDRVGCSFHGRDIMAPVAAHLANGVSLNSLGPPLMQDDLFRLDYKNAHFSSTGKEISGIIISVDKFGNLTTNIPVSMLSSHKREIDLKKVDIIIGNKKIKGLSNSYSDSEIHSPLAIVGSREFLEIAVNCGNAREFFNAKRFDPVQVILLK